MGIPEPPDPLRAGFFALAATGAADQFVLAAVCSELGFDGRLYAQVQILQPILARVEPVLFTGQEVLKWVATIP